MYLGQSIILKSAENCYYLQLLFRVTKHGSKTISAPTNTFLGQTSDLGIFLVHKPGRQNQKERDELVNLLFFHKKRFRGFGFSGKSSRKIGQYCKSLELAHFLQWMFLNEKKPYCHEFLTNLGKAQIFIMK